MSHTGRVDTDNHDLRIVLIGKTGVGKSETANTILNANIFKSQFCPKSVTQKCQYASKQRFDRDILIIDTPGLFDISLKKEVICHEIQKCVAISSPGPHAFLLVISLSNRFTEEEASVFNEIHSMFGDNLMKYLIVVFTFSDWIGDSIETYIEDYPSELKDILQTAGGKYFVLRNKGNKEEKEHDVRNLFDQIDKMVRQSGGEYFVSDMFKKAEEVMQETIAQKLAEREKELQEEYQLKVQNDVKEIIAKERYQYQLIHEENVEAMKQMKVANAKGKETIKRMTEQLEKEKNISLMELFKGGKKRRELGGLIKQEIAKEAEHEELAFQMKQKVGKERTEAEHKLAAIGMEIKDIADKRMQVQGDIAEERIYTELREEERKKIEMEDKGTLARFKETLKSYTTRFLNLFK